MQRGTQPTVATLTHRAMTVILGLAAASMFGLTDASADNNFHQYSVATENSDTGYTGFQVTRITQAVTGQPQTGCSSPYSGDPVYQTSWLLITSDAQNWDEMGVAHQCNDTYRYYFWGYGENGAWHSLGTLSGALNGTNHTYQVSRSFTGTNYYDFWTLDGQNKASLLSLQRGAYVQAGLESYSSNATVSGYTNNTLKYQKNEGSFVNWAGRDANIVNPSMCGSWASDTSWNSGEHVSC